MIAAVIMETRIGIRMLLQIREIMSSRFRSKYAMPLPVRTILEVTDIGSGSNSIRS